MSMRREIVDIIIKYIRSNVIKDMTSVPQRGDALKPKPNVFFIKRQPHIFWE
jgi:septum formation topological specificity factor MinE